MNIPSLKTGGIERSESAAPLDVLLEHSFDAIALLGADGQILYASPSTRHVLGYDARQVQVRQLADFIHPDDQSTCQRVLETANVEPRMTRAVSIRMQNRAGAWRRMEGFLKNHLYDARVSAIVLNYRDCTERDQAKAALAEGR